MNKQKIIKLLDKEVELFTTTEDENSLGELYITEEQFKSAELVLTELEILRDKIATQEARLREAVESDQRFTVIKDSRGTFNDMELFGKLCEPYVAINSQIIISNCSFLGEEYKDSMLKEE